MTDASENLLMHAPCGIFSFTEDGVITNANAYCCRLLEYKEEEISGLNISSLLTISGRIFYQTHFYPLVKLHLQIEEIFLNLQSKSGKDVPVVMNAIVADTTSVTEIVCSFIQVLNRRKYEDEILLAKRKAEEALRENEALKRVKGELKLREKELDEQVTLLKYQNNELLQLGNVIAHDLQEPVRKLILFSNELLNQNIQESRKDHALSILKKSSQRVKRLLVNLQEYLEMTLNSQKKTAVNLDEIAGYELEQLQKTYTNTRLSVEKAQLPVIRGSAEQLHFLFYNLLKNAFEHGTIDNELNLRITAVIVKENLFNSNKQKYSYIDFVKISISDKGAGFDNHYKEYIFEVLKKLNSNDNSTGFGLAFCKKIAEAHFGSIYAESEIGSGTTFTVMLPINYNYDYLISNYDA